MSPPRGRLLITGASGFLGGATAAVLERRGWALVRAVREPRDAGSITLDLSDVRSVARLAELRDIDGVVHLAAKVDLTTTSVTELYTPNVAAVATLAAIAKSWEASFILASTVLVSGVDILEPRAPGRGYTCSKWLAELLTEASSRSVALLRFSGIFGWNGPAHLGLNRAIAAAARGKPPVLVGEGRGRRNYIYVGDAAAQIAHALEHRVLGTHVIAGTEVLSIREMLDTVCETFLAGRHPEQRPGPDAADQIFAPSAAFPPTRTFRAALADIKAALL